MSSEEAFKICASEYLPKFVQFETGTECNSNCKMCPRDKMTPRTGATWATITRVIETLIPNTKSTCPFLMQEPFTDPRLFAIMDNIKMVNSECDISIFTNMALVDEEMAKRILESQNVDVLNISFYGATEELYNEWQKGLDWEQTKENIRRFMKLKREGRYNKPHVSMNFLALKDHMPHIEDFFQEWRGIPDEICFTHFDTFHGDIPDYGAEEEIWEPAAEKRVPCSRLWKSFNVHCNGNVVACCIDYDELNVVGNIHDEHPAEIWRGEKLSELRKLHMEGRYDEIPLCRDCRVWRREEPEQWITLWS